MVATLFYVDSVPDVGALAVVEGDEGFHAATVRRIRPGETLVLADGDVGVCVPRDCEYGSWSAVVRWPGPILVGTVALALVGLLTLPGYRTSYNDRNYLRSNRP